MFKVFRAKSFDDDLEKISELKEWVSGIEDQLMNYPYVGKPLDYKWFREKRFGKYRLYFLIYDNLKAVYIIALSDKKDQQKIINTIKLFFYKYKSEVENLVKK